MLLHFVFVVGSILCAFNVQQFYTFGIPLLDRKEWFN